MVCTVLAGIASSMSHKYAVILILGLSIIKFMGVAFEFMELKVAHNFWKIAIIVYVLVFAGILLIII